MNGAQKLQGYDVYSLLHYYTSERPAPGLLAKINLDLRVLHKRPDGFP